jgi:predicted nucleotidyltransferase
VTTTEAPDEAAVAAALRRAGARFAFAHGSRATGERARPDSDLDVAAWWGDDPPAPWDVGLPAGVDLLILDDAPLELAGRVAVDGRLLFEDDPPARVAWQAQTRTIYFDEEWRQRWVRQVFIEAHADG